MAAQYPTALPTQPSRGATKNLATTETDIQDDLYEELIAVATELAVNPSGAFATVAARLDNMTTRTPVSRIIGPYSNSGPTTHLVKILSQDNFAYQIFRIKGNAFGHAEVVPRSDVSFVYGGGSVTLDRFAISVPESGPWYFMFRYVAQSTTIETP